MELTTPPLLSAKSVSCSFGGLRAVADFTFVLEPGVVVALIGPNGAGKTTAFNLFCGYVKPSAGSIEVGGRSVVGSRPHQIAQLGVGRTFQDCRVFDQLTVLENVMLGYRAEKWETLVAALVRGQQLRAFERSNESQALALLTDAGLGDKIREQARDLSYGQRKLLELCRIQSFNPKVLLLDEPFAGLFPDIAETMASMLKGLANDGRAVIFIEHDMDAVSRLADRVVVLNFGRKIADGPPEEVLNDAGVLDAYLGRVGHDAP